jgi:hypothetical protein
LLTAPVNTLLITDKGIVALTTVNSTKQPAHSASGITERQWLRQLTDVAKTLGWRPYHTQFSKWSEAGWPDLALCKPPRLLLVELKSEHGDVTPAEHEWLTMLEQCPGIDVYLWRPSDIDLAVKVLR